MERRRSARLSAREIIQQNDAEPEHTNEQLPKTPPPTLPIKRRRSVRLNGMDTEGETPDSPPKKQHRSRALSPMSPESPPPEKALDERENGKEDVLAELRNQVLPENIFTSKDINWIRLFLQFSTAVPETMKDIKDFIIQHVTSAQ